MHVLARICVERPVFATVLSLTLIVVGVVSYKGLGVDRYPQVDFPRVSVSTSLPGASPDQVETDVTDRIERECNTISGIDFMTSTSSQGLSSVFLQFQLSKDVDVAAEEVRAKVALARRDLPPDVREPVVSKFDLGAIPVVSFGVSSPGSARDTYEYVDKVLRRRVESVSGVGEVQLIGGRERQINVVIDPYRLRAYGLTPKDVSEALDKQNIEVPGGLVEQGKRSLSLRTMGRLTNVADFDMLPVANPPSGPVYIRDIGHVEDAEARATSIASVNGRETVLMQVVKQSDANAVEVIRDVKVRMDELAKTLPSGYTVQVVRDQSTYILASLNAVREHLVLGAFLAALVVLLFLGNARSTVIASLAIPTSIIATFGLMKALDFTQNSVTLLALTLSVGIVIDDAIVVLENIYRVMEEQGLSPHDAAIQATKEIGLAVLAITISLVAVFLPVANMDGTIGRFLHSFGITMAGAIVVSMLVSFTTTPMLCSRWLKRPTHTQDGSEPASKSGWFGRVEHVYGRSIEVCERFWPIVIIACVGVLFSIMPLLKLVPMNFQPDDDESQYQISVRAPESTSLEATRRICEGLASDVLKSMPETKLVVVSAGADNAQTANLGSVYVRMNEVEERHNRRVSQYSVMDMARKKILPKYRGRGLILSVQKISSFGGSSNAAVQIAIKGPDLAKLGQYSQQAVARIKKIPGVADCDSTLIMNRPELQAHIDRKRAADLGAKVEDVAQALRLAVAGDDKISTFDEAGEGYEVHVRLAAQFRSGAEALALLSVPTTVGGVSSTVTADQVVTFSEEIAPATIDRLNRQRQCTLRTNIVKGANQQGVTLAVAKVLDDLHMEPSYSTERLGQAREQVRMLKNFGIAFVLSFVFMYLVIAAQFESFVQALVIMFTLPLTVPFAIISIYITGDSLNSYSMLGMLVLLGVVKKNAILQLDRANQLREAGMGLVEATVQASKDRLRPILMTTLAFVAGMFPLVISRGTGSATNRTTASVIVGGQIFSLVLTLIAAPVMYVVLERLVGGERRRRKETPSDD